MNQPSLEIIRRNLIVQFQTDDSLYATEDHLVWKSSDQGRTWQQLCRLEPRCTTLAGLAKDSFLRSALVRVWRRNPGITNLVVLNSGTIIMQYDKMYRFDGTSRYARPFLDLVGAGIQAPLKNGLAYDRRTDTVYFGEYITRRLRAIRIFRGREDGRRWELCYRFPEGRIRHIHNMVADPYRPRIWICAGDNDTESGIFFTDDDFRSVQMLAGGDQSWRAVSLIPTPEAIIWGSDGGRDAPAGTKNAIYRLDLASGKRQKLLEIDNPAYYHAELADHAMVIGTTCEPGMPGNPVQAAALYYSEDGISWRKLLSLHYQRQKRRTGTRYGTIFLPRGRLAANELFFTPVNVRDYDFTLMRIHLR